MMHGLQTISIISLKWGRTIITRRDNSNATSILIASTHNNLFEKLNLSKHTDRWVSILLNPDQQVQLKSL